MADLTTIILTYNEELNIRECIESVKVISKRIVVIDSYSTDKTLEIARGLGAEIFQNNWINYAQQFNFALEKTNINTTWVLRLDADERLTNESAKEIDNLCLINLSNNVNGIIIRFEVSFLGRKLRHGGIYPIKVLRVFKFGKARIEDRNMDEHMILTEGLSVEAKFDSLHIDDKNLFSWTDKHNKYSDREVIDYFNTLQSYDGNLLDKNARIKRFLKYNLYYKLPLGLRPLMYFIYRYLFRLGFLDGVEGLIFCVLQSFWYRFLVDAKILEQSINRKVGSK